MAFQKMSESVYVGLCHEIGTPQQVASRRNRTDDWELLLNQVLKDECKLQIMISGSQKEGFRFRSSDIDIMYWPTNLRVIWDFSQIQFDNIQRHVPVIFDSSESPTGFTLLLLPLECLEFVFCDIFEISSGFNVPLEAFKNAFYYVMTVFVEQN